MPLRQVSGTRVPANFHQAAEQQVGVREPTLILYANGRAQMNVRCGDLVSATGVTDPNLVKKVVDYAKNVPEDAPWTKQMVKDLCKLIGRVPFPTLLSVEHLQGQGTALLRVVTEEGPGVTPLHYGKQSNRPSFNGLPVVRMEGIKIPEGMCLEVPVALVLDGNYLKVEAKLSKGVQRQVKTDDDEESAVEGKDDQDEMSDK